MRIFNGSLNSKEYYLTFLIKEFFVGSLAFSIDSFQNCLIFNPEEVWIDDFVVIEAKNRL